MLCDSAIENVVDFYFREFVIPKLKPNLLVIDLFPSNYFHFALKLLPFMRNSIYIVLDNHLTLSQYEQLLTKEGISFTKDALLGRKGLFLDKNKVFLLVLNEKLRSSQLVAELSKNRETFSLSFDSLRRAKNPSKFLDKIREISNYFFFFVKVLSFPGQLVIDNKLVKELSELSYEYFSLIQCKNSRKSREKSLFLFGLASLP